MNRQRLLDRFLRYVQIDTTADEHAREYPSSAGQWTLGRLLCDELQAMGIGDARQNEYGLILATVPASVASSTPVVALNAHLDTSPETSGKDVRPQVIQAYDGRDIALPEGNRVIRVAENPELNELRGKTLITSDGTTLLGADDKAGLAIIMEVAQTLRESSQSDQPMRHGAVRILFTCDEEIGRGVDHVDLDELNADVCYTLDGPAAGHIDVETFSADLAVIRIEGVNIHPAIAKDRMVNAVKVAAAIVSLLPHDLTPETTCDREGFLHPYRLDGHVAAAELRILARDFDTDALRLHTDRLQRIIDQVQTRYPQARIELDVQRQYRNLADGLAREPRAVALAELAHHRLGLACVRSMIRGGTDGSRLTELGLPTPNLSSGQHNPHSPLEWACLDEMAQAVDITVETIRLWAANG